MIHSPQCETWQAHLRREIVALGGEHPSFHRFLDDVLHSWETELLVNDPEFWGEFESLTEETRQSLDLARRITEDLPASPVIDRPHNHVYPWSEVKAEHATGGRARCRLCPEPVS